MNNRIKDLIPKVRAAVKEHGDDEELIMQHVMKDTDYTREEVKDMIFKLVYQIA